MRKGFLKLTMIAVMLVTFLCSSQQAFAMEALEKISKNEEAKSLFDSFGEEVSDDVKSDIEESKLPVFLVMANYNDQKVFFHSFYVRDTYGTGGSYLVSSVAAFVYAQAGADLYIVIDGSAYKLECLGQKDSVSYLKCPEISKYTAIDLKENVTDKNLCAVHVIVNGDSEFVLTKSNLDISSWKDHGGYYASGEKMSDVSLLGVPLFDKTNYELVGMIEMDVETTETVVINLTETAFEKSYALATGTPKENAEPSKPAETEPAATTQEPEQPVETDPIASEEPVAITQEPEQPAETEPVATTQEPEQPTETEPKPTIQGKDTSSSVPEWAYLAIIAVIVLAVYLSKNKKSGKKKEKKSAEVSNDEKEYPKEGTISLDRNETIKQEATIKSVPAEPTWQIRGMSGTFMGKTFALTDVLQFGRNPQNQIAFPQNTKGISGSHCELSMENGRIILRDLGSTYGTYLKTGEKINARVACELKEGDIFYLAENSQSFRVERVGESRQQFTPAVKAAMYPKAGEIYRADASGRLQFGRSANSQVSFGADDSKISTSHCVLYRENDALYLMDLGSTNGTYFSENKRLQPNVPYRVEKGMAFFLTSQNYMFVIVED